MEAEKRNDALKKIKDELLVFKKSPLYKYRTENKYFPVIGEGSHFAKIVLVGEAPGKNEALQGRPFCGASGRVLNQLLESSGTKREDVYITNIVKDRPPENRDPTEEEKKIYAPFLDRQIEIIQPKVIAALGRHSMEYLMNRFNLADKLEPISYAHGKAFEAKASYGRIYIVALYHPAASIYNINLRSTLVSDFKIINSLV
ncbi:MAG: uracil-DNA glycosylase [Candidatus Vogelbacteria bacterium]|nr:uracil-DNA glycosylase [Candidatus Vogelbacteria bacterium]